MSSYWWVLLLRGVLAILFGIAAYAWPGMKGLGGSLDDLKQKLAGRA